MSVDVAVVGFACEATAYALRKIASCGIRTHDLPLTERVLYQLS